MEDDIDYNKYDYGMMGLGLLILAIVTLGVIGSPNALNIMEWILGIIALAAAAICLIQPKIELEEDL